MWQKWKDVQPTPGQKIIAPYEDGSGAVVGLVIDHDGAGEIDVLYAEDGMSLMRYPGAERIDEFAKRIWAALPQDYPIAFMEQNDDY